MTIVANVLRNVASNWAGLGVNMLVTFFLSPFVVNTLGSLYYGIWALTMQFTAYLYLLDFGVRDSIIRYTARYRGLGQGRRLNQFLTMSMAIYSPIAVIGMVVTTVGVVGFPYWFGLEADHVYEARVALALVGATIAQGFIFNAFVGILQGLQRFEIVNVIGVVSSLLRAVLVVAALRRGHGIIGLSLIQFGLSLAGNLLVSYFALRLLRKEDLPFRLTWVGARRGRVLVRRIVGYSTYIFINNIGQKIILGTDAVVIGIFMPVATVTYYAIAGNLISLLRGIVMSTIWVLMPLASHYAALRQFDEVRALLIRGSKVALLVALPLCAGFVVTGERFIELWMGPEYSPMAGRVLLILALAEVFSAPHHAMSVVLLGLSRHRVMAWLRIGEAIVNLAISIWLVQSIGLVGVALGTTIPHIFVMLFVLPVMVCRVVGLPYREYLARAYVGPFVAVIPFVGGLVLLREWWPAPNLVVFFLQTGLLVLPYAWASYGVALTSLEREAIKRYVGRLVASLPAP